MKLYKYLLIALAAALGTACDDIAKDDRYIEMEPVNPQRAVLIEEFTGQNCTNCPDGHATIAKLRQQYGSAVIPVCIHASRLSDSEGFGEYQGLAIPDGEIYYKNAGSPNLPTALIDRQGKPLNVSDWADAVREQLAIPAPAGIDVEALYIDVDKEKPQLLINTRVLSAEDLDCNLQVWLTENDIVTYQLDHGDFKLDYVHNHVLRYVVNGVDGEPVKLQRNIYADNHFNVDLKTADPKSRWKVANMNAVVFLYNASGVIQAAEVPVTFPEEE